MTGRADQQLGPEWLAHRFDETINQIRFARYERADRSQVPFLTDEYLPARNFRSEPRNRARELAPATAPIHFILHSGFCCSTLLAACFDQPGLASTFSEPMILNDIAGWRRRGAPPAEIGALLKDALALLSRPFTGDDAAIVKPSTVVNGLASAMMTVRPDARAIVMHAPLQDFVTSIAKKGLDGRLWARQLFLGMRMETLVDGLGFGDEQFFGQTDLQIAAIAWLGQQRLFASLLAAYPGRVRSLNSKDFLDDPARAIRACGNLFGLQLAPNQVDAATAGPLARNSKDGKPFTRGAREAEYRSARDAHGDEIRKVVSWAESVASSAGVKLKLDQPL